MSDLVWTPIEVEIGQVIPWEHNPRFSTKAAAQRLIDSEKQIGTPMTLAVGPFTTDHKVPLYDGHQRCAAWNTVKPATFKVWALQSDRELTEAERSDVSLFLHLATGQWDWNKLTAWPAEQLISRGFDQEALKTWNSDAGNLREMLQAEGEPLDVDQEWQGMPEFEQEDKTAFKSLIVHFDSLDDMKNFSEFIDQSITEKTKSIWYPRKERENLKALAFTNES